MVPPSVQPRPPAASRGAPRRRRSAFTLIEVLVVIGIIVLLIALALPAFNFITGSRSTEAAANQISASLSIARAQAVGLQQTCGVMFFIEPTSDRIQLALVRETARPTGAGTDKDAGSANIDIYLDLVPNTEFVKLPAGVGIQGLTNSMVTLNAQERYIGFNGTLATNVAVGGPTPRQYGCDSNNSVLNNTSASTSAPLTAVGAVILFDANGQLVTKTYALRTRFLPNTGSPTLFNATDMGQLVYFTTLAKDDTTNPALAIADYIPAKGYAFAPVSQIGFVLYDQQAFTSKNFTLGDDNRVDGVATYSTSTSEYNEEQWLDANGTPTMINRYNGTLIRGE